MVLDAVSKYLQWLKSLSWELGKPVFKSHSSSNQLYVTQGTLINFSKLIFSFIKQR